MVFKVFQSKLQILEIAEFREKVLLLTLYFISCVCVSNEFEYLQGIIDEEKFVLHKLLNDIITIFHKSKV